MEPFRIDVPTAVLDDLCDRLRRTRWPDEIEGPGWADGTDLEYLRKLVAYWTEGFDWRAQEARLNRLAQFRTEIDGLGIHFVHERGRGEGALPLLLTHGWPDAFWRFERLIPLLTHPDDPSDEFDVVVPSIPGFGFSDRPREPGWGPTRVADAFAALMTSLGYDRFAAHGGDWGANVTDRLAHRHPGRLVGIHLTDLPPGRADAWPAEDATDEERRYLDAFRKWREEEGAYAHVQATQPQTLAYGLNDSPAGLAGWLVEKLRAWSDCGGAVERRFSKDALLTNATLYWATGTAGSSFRLYLEDQREPPRDPARTEVPTGFAMPPGDFAPAPRSLAGRLYDLRRWTELPRGGHFAAYEEPELVADEIRAFFRPLRGGAERRLLEPQAGRSASHRTLLASHDPHLPGYRAL